MFQRIKNNGEWFFLTVVLLISACNEGTQPPVDNKLAVVQLKDVFDLKNKYLIEADYGALSEIIHDNVVYGHSNCWIQDKEDITGVTPKDSLTYIKIEANDLNIDVIGETGIIQGTAQFVGIYKLDTFDLNLCFVETYAHIDDSWKLVARQSASVPKE